MVPSDDISVVNFNVDFCVRIFCLYNLSQDLSNIGAHANILTARNMFFAKAFQGTFMESSTRKM